MEQRGLLSSREGGAARRDRTVLSSTEQIEILQTGRVTAELAGFVFFFLYIARLYSKGFSSGVSTRRLEVSWNRKAEQINSIVEE